MKNKFLPIIFLGITLWTCNLIEGKPADKAPKKMTYSYACLDSAVSGNKVNRTISKTTDLIRKVAIKDDAVTDAVQTEYGDAFHKDAVETKTFVLVEDPIIVPQLQKMLDDLLRVRETPSAIKYSIYYLDDKAVNAFTFGGRIYITKGMYEKTKDKPELLYFIIGHEIGHSEKGHIKKTIQDIMISQKIFGEDNGMTFFQLQKLVTASFNQVNELEADYYGTDLTYKLDQDLCTPVDFWKEMSKAENQYNKVEDFFRTHPFSALRAQCLKDHILANFGTSCSK